MILHDILGALAVVSFLSTVWQWLAARRFPLHRRSADLRPGALEFRLEPASAHKLKLELQQNAAIRPAVTLLKPLKGADEFTESCLRSWLAQNYPGEIQALFGVAGADDPACAVVKKLLAEFPQRDAQLVVCPERLGANAKVSKLAQLEPLAKHDIIVVSDADVRVPADLLANVVATLGEEGRAGSFLSLEGEGQRVRVRRCPVKVLRFSLTPARSRWEGAARRTCAWRRARRDAPYPHAGWPGKLLLSVRQPDDARDAVGSHRGERGFLEPGVAGGELSQTGFRARRGDGHAAQRPGGNRRVSGADGLSGGRFSTGQPHRAARLSDRNLPRGRGVLVAADGLARGVAASTALGADDPRVPAAAIFLQHREQRDVVAAIVGGGGAAFDCQPERRRFFRQKQQRGVALPWALFWAVVFLLVRVLVADDLQRRLTPSHSRLSNFWLVPVKDLLQAALWAGAFAGNHIEWRGERYRLRRDGTLKKE